MQSDSAVTVNAGMPADVESEPVVGAEALAGSPRAAHSLIDVLLPATPPEPRNARIIRRFDLEAAKNDPKAGEQPVEKPVTPQSRSREEAKALRNRSLAAAAGLV